ncbi:hypothetical protein I4U23_025335 [Adineta vaga]|nr:hypothetical protein I4U23_025335 [Adineta vaga]
MAANEDNSEKWLEMDDDGSWNPASMESLKVPDRIAGLLSPDQVNLVNMTIKADTRFSTDTNVSIERHGPMIIYWKGLIANAIAYSIASLDTSLLDMIPLIQFKPDIDWLHSNLTPSIFSFPQKQYHINFNETDKVIDSDDKIKYFAQEHTPVEDLAFLTSVKIHVTNQGAGKMVLIICANRLDVDIDLVAQSVVQFAPSLKTI